MGANKPAAAPSDFDCSVSLKGIGDWAYALVLEDASDVTFVAKPSMPDPLLGQGIWSVDVVNTTLRVLARKVKAVVWNATTKGAVGLPPQSPLTSDALEAEEQELLLYPYGATDPRVTELPTTAKPT